MTHSTSHPVLGGTTATDVAPHTATVIAVLGGSGGVGASVLASVLATRAAHLLADDAPVALVDLHPQSATLAVLHAVESASGLTWPQLVGADGEIDPSALLSRLPRDRSGVAVLGWPVVEAQEEDAEPQELTPTARRAVLQALSAGCRIVVLDMPDLVEELAPDHVVLLSGTGLTAIAGACAVARQIAVRAPQARTHLVIRCAGGRRARPGIKRAIAAETGIPLRGVIPEDAGVERAAWAGLPPGSRTGHLTRFVDGLLTEIEFPTEIAA